MTHPWKHGMGLADWSVAEVRAKRSLQGQGAEATCDYTEAGYSSPLALLSETLYLTDAL